MRRHYVRQSGGRQRLPGGTAERLVDRRDVDALRRLGEATLAGTASPD